MQFLALSCEQSTENLAVDEALLAEAEDSTRAHEVLRIWEPTAALVVVGCSSHVDREVHVDVCRSRGIPILRRTSGGTSIVAGPGCLMYALLLSYQLRPALRSLDAAHTLVMDTMAGAIGALVPGVSRGGICDLTYQNRKLSGNSVRCRRQHVLYHGTVLYDFELELIDACLAMPPRQPEYRADRAHRDFVANLPVSGAELSNALRQAWHASDDASPPSGELVERLVAEKYSQDAWNFRH